MEAITSRHRYHRATHEDLGATRNLRREIDWTQVKDAIIAYFKGRIDRRRLMRHCTHLEVNEFARFAHSAHYEWKMYHEHQLRFVVDSGSGAFSYSRGNLHFEHHTHFRPLPNMEVSFESRLDGLRGGRVGTQNFGDTFSAEFDNNSFGTPGSRGVFVGPEYSIEYGDNPTRPNHGRGDQSRRFDSEYEDQYDESFDNYRRQSFEVTDEYESYSSRSEIYFDHGSFREDEHSGPYGGQDFDWSDFSRRPRGPPAIEGASDSIPSTGQPLSPKLSSRNHQALERGNSNRRHGGALAPASKAHGDGARGGQDSASAHGATSYPAHGGRGSRRGGQARTIMTHRAEEHGNGAVELDSNQLFELATGTKSGYADPTKTRSLKRVHFEEPLGRV